MQWVIPKGVHIKAISHLWSPQPLRPTADTWAQKARPARQC